MIKRGTVIGDASPILKTCTAFNLKCPVQDTVIFALEHRMEDEACNKIAFEYGRYLSASALSLPKGEFALYSDFYESAIETGIAVKSLDGQEIYESVGAYAESLDADSEDAVDAKRYLDLACKYLHEVFVEAGIKDMPSVTELQEMCFTGENYSEVQQKLHEIFSGVQEQGQFNKLMHEAMSGFHQAYMEEFCEEYDFEESGALLDYHVYQAMPFGLAPEVTVAKVYTNFLPILLASGVRLDQSSFFAYRLECGRKMLRQFAGSKMEDNPIEAMTAALSDKLEKLAPYLPAFAVKRIKESGAYERMAQAFVRNIWFAVPIETIEADALESLFSALFSVLDGIDDEFDGD